MAENVLGLSVSGITWHSVLLAPYRFVHLMVEVATTAWAVVPLVALAAWVAVKERRGSIYLVSLFVALAVLLVVLTDVGTGWNQLIDVVVLSALVIGELAARVRVGSAGSRAGRADRGNRSIGLAMLWVTLTGFVVTLAPPVKATIRGEVSYREDPLSGPAFPGISILSEDPYVPLSLGQVPVVLDPFMLPRLAEKEPDAIPDLIRRIETQEFDIVVLVEPLEPVDRYWWTEQDLGIDVVTRHLERVHYAGRAQGYYLYEPRQAGSRMTVRRAEPADARSTIERALVRILTYRPDIDGRIIVAGALAVYFLVVAIPRMFWGIDVWPRLGVPSGPSLFFDTRNLTAALECRRLGFDPLVESPCDPWGRPLNYPRVWLALRWLGLNQSHTTVLVCSSSRCSSGRSSCCWGGSAWARAS